MRWFEVVAVAALLGGSFALAGAPGKTTGRCGGLEVVATLAAAPATFTCREFSRDGALFALGSTDGVVRVFDATKGALVATLGEPAPRRPTPDPRSPPAEVRRKRPPDGRHHEAPREREDDDVPRPRGDDGPFPASAAVRTVTFSPSGTTLLVGEGSGRISEWRLADGKLVAVYEGHQQPIVQVHVSPDGRRVLSLANDQTMRLWDTDGGRPVATFPLRRPFFTNEFSGDSRVFAVAGADAPVLLIDAKTGEVARPLKGPPGAVQDVRFSADGQRVVLSGDPSSALYDVATGEPLATLDGFYARLSDDGRRALTVKADATVALWDGRTGKPIATLRGHQRSLHRAEFSPDGALVASASYDDTTRLWSAADGKPLATLPLVPSHEAWVTRDGACVVTGGEGTIGLFRRGGAKAAVVTTPPRVMTTLLDREGRRVLVMHGQGATLLAIP